MLLDYQQEETLSSSLASAISKYSFFPHFHTFPTPPFPSLVAISWGGEGGSPRCAVDA
jgi:hypothetical protein